MDKSLLLSATSSDETPVSGFQINEIVKSTNVNYDACSQIQTFLLDRLSKKKNHNVKFKCLVLIKHICRTGRPEFRRDIQRSTDVIREHLQFKGTPDPLRGDQIYQKVRDAAREALDAIFASQAPISGQATTVNRIVGIGSSLEGPTSTGGRGTGSSQAGGKLDPKKWFSKDSQSTSDRYVNHNRTSESGMQGFGNPNFATSAEQKGIWTKASSAVGSLARRATGGKNDNQQTLNVGGYQNHTSMDAPAYDPYEHQKSQLGAGGFSSGSQLYGGQAMGAWGGRAAPPPQPPAALGGAGGGRPPPPPVTGRAGGAATGGEYERHQIEELCTPRGTRAAPDPELLRAFLAAAPTLDAETVGSLLLEQVARPEWQVKSKALAVCAAAAADPACGALREYLVDWAEEMIEPECASAKAGVRERAAAALRALGLAVPEGGGGAGAAAGKPARARPTPPPQGFSFLEADEAGAGAGVAPVQGSGASEPDLLGLDPPSQPGPSPALAPPAASDATSLLDNNEVLAPRATAVHSAESGGLSGGLFAGMQTKASPAPSHPATAPPAAEPPAPSPDLLGSTPAQQLAAAAAAPAAAPADLFGDLSMKSTPPPQTPSMASQQAPGPAAAAASGPVPGPVAPPAGTLLGELAALEPPTGAPGGNIPMLTAQGPPPGGMSAPVFDPLLAGSSQSALASQSAGNPMALQMQQLQYQNMLLQEQMRQLSMAGAGRGGMMPRPQAPAMVVGHSPMQYNAGAGAAALAGVAAAGGAGGAGGGGGALPAPTVLPVAGQAQSGFGFLAAGGGGAGGGAKKEDSFSFVKDQMMKKA